MKKTYSSPEIQRLLFAKESILNASKDNLVYDEFDLRGVTPEDQLI